MDQSDMAITIAALEAKIEVDRTQGGIKEKLGAAMRATRDHWLVTDEDSQFRAAISGVMLYYGEGSEEYNRLRWEMEALNRIGAAISAAMSGIGVDFFSTLGEQKYEPIGLLKLWREVHDRRAPPAQLRFNRSG